MQHIIQELNQLVNDYAHKFASIPSERFVTPPAPGKWSNQEVVGHLIDSAHNNLRRFIVGQYQQNDKIVYDQDFWNSVNDYRQMKQGDVITLWILLNKQISTVLKNMPSDKYENTIDTGKEIVEPKTLFWLAEDYVKHMKHHFNQILPNSFDIEYH